MEWSTLLNRVALLNIYIGPEAEVSTLVRHQLMTDSDEAQIMEAVTVALNKDQKLENVYDAYLLSTSLDIAHVVAKVGIQPLVEAMFDLNLGDWVKRLQLSDFRDLHEARDVVEKFVLRWTTHTVQGRIWWDIIDPSMTPRPSWISRALEEDPGFYEVFGRWQAESDELQRWLDGLERSPAMVNNPASGMDVVYSADVALGIIGLAEVRCSDTWKNWVADAKCRCRGALWTCAGETTFPTDPPGFSRNARLWAYSKQGCPGFHNSSSINCPRKR